MQGEESESTEMCSSARVVRETEIKEGVWVGQTDIQTQRARGFCDAYLLALDVWSISIPTAF